MANKSGAAATRRWQSNARVRTVCRHSRIGNGPAAIAPCPRALWQMNRFDEALRLFEEAAASHPQNLVALIDGSRALGARFEITRAEAMLDRLMKLGAHRPDVLHLAGQSYRMMFRPLKAMECFQRVLTISRRQFQTRSLNWRFFTRWHRLDEASVLIENCLRVHTDYVEAQLFKARLLRLAQTRIRVGEDLFRKLSTSSDVHPLVQAQAWAELAQNFDRQEHIAPRWTRCLSARKSCCSGRDQSARNPTSFFSICGVWRTP